jgi:hypothetical protein
VAGDSGQDFGKGLDVGTSFVRFAERQGQDVILRSERNAFIDITRYGFTESMLTSVGAEYARDGDQIHVVGDKSMRFAYVLGRDARRPISSGIISPSEKEALPMIELILRGTMGRPRDEGETLYYSMPGLPLDAEANLVYHEKILQGMLQKLGYAPTPINEGLAMIFSELADHSFTGVGMSFGGGMVNVCFAYLSVPVLTFSLTTAGDWIDQQAAMAVGEKASVVCSIKEAVLDLTKSEGLSKIEVALSICYDKLISYVLENVRSEFVKRVKMPVGSDPLPIVLGGGTASPKGFLDRFTEALRRIDLPLEIGPVRMARDPLSCVATGALVAAQAEEMGKKMGEPLRPPTLRQESSLSVSSEAAHAFPADALLTQESHTANG